MLRLIHSFVACALAATATLAAAVGPPLLVAPGRAEGLAPVATGCPTFIWTVQRPGPVDLVVWELGADETPGAESLTISLPEGATAWQPAADECLAPGRYAWAVRAGEAEGGVWSEPALFEVPAPSEAEVAEALEVLRRFRARESEVQATVPNLYGGPAPPWIPQPSPRVEAQAGAEACELLSSGLRVETEVGPVQTCGVVGITHGNGAIGVLGVSNAESGGEVGVRGAAPLSNTGVGVLGVGAAGVRGEGFRFGALGKATGFAAFGGFFVNSNKNVFDTNGLLLAANDEESTDDLEFKVDKSGNVFADGGYHCGNAMDFGSGFNEAELEPCLNDSAPADFAEMMPSVPGLEPGDVLVVSADGTLERSSRRNQPSVAGVHSTRPSYLGASRFRGQEGYAPLAITGLVPIKASAENGPIRPGDLLVSSATPGHAMRSGRFPRQGTVIGKALEELPAGTGKIRILLVLQ